MQQTPHVTFASTATMNDNTSSGLPQVSVLTFKKQKDALKKRREAIIAGKGRSYRAVGTHRRSTTKHTWTYGELAELSATFIEHYNKKPILKIAEEVHASFAIQLHHQQQQQQQQQVQADNQEEQVAQLREPRTHLPTVTAIELKLMDCISLNFNDTENFISKPSQMHHEVWAHLLCAQKHRTMIRDMKGKSQPEQQQQQAAQQQQADEDREIWNVHAREFLYDTVAEYETAFPEAKRRKFNPSAEEVVIGEIDMSDVCEALEEIANELETREQARQQDNAAIALSMAIIRQQQQDIETLLEYMEDTQSGMELCQKRINDEMAKIDAIVQRGGSSSAPATSASASASAPTSTPASAAQVGPLTLTANSQFDPNDYRCRECKGMFDPRNGGYWLIGPNRETGDTFYLCSECTKFMEDTPQAPHTPAQRIDEEESDDCCGGDCDCCESVDDYDYYNGGYYDDEPKQGDYDHSEECS